MERGAELRSALMDAMNLIWESLIMASSQAKDSGLLVLVRVKWEFLRTTEDSKVSAAIMMGTGTMEREIQTQTR